MRINKSWFTFRRDEQSSWICPTCGGGSLILKPEELRVVDSAKTANTRGEDWFDADFVQYRFSAVLYCANNRCNEAVAVAGSGMVEEVHEQDCDGQWDTKFIDQFSPQFFQPNLVPITVPENTPIAVINSLHSAFSIIFANHNAAANQLRASIEVLLDEQGIQSKREDGEFIALGRRINDHLSGELIKYKDRLSAIQWIGNDGSHGNGAISVDDLLDGLQIIESLLIAIYPTPSTDIDALARQLIDKKKPQRLYTK